jgi:hypothetical protein
VDSNVLKKKAAIKAYKQRHCLKIADVPHNKYKASLTKSILPILKGLAEFHFHMPQRKPVSNKTF